MTDTTIKGTGNSRSIRSVPNLAALAPTYEKLLEYLTGQGLPVDILGLNPAGCDQIGTDLTKASLLKDATEAAIWGAAANRTPDQALAQLGAMVKAAQGTADQKIKCEIGSYQGTKQQTGDTNMTYETTSLVFQLTPRLVIIETNNPKTHLNRPNLNGETASPLILINPCDMATAYYAGGPSTSNKSVEVRWGSNNVEWSFWSVATMVAHAYQSYKYTYLAIG